MNKNKNAIEQIMESDNETFDFDELERKLESDLEEQMSDLNLLKKDREKISNPDTLGETVMNVAWEQFLIQVGIVAGEDFIIANRDHTLDLRDKAHI